MTSKEDLVDYIKEWITIDNEVRDIQKVMREKKQRKKDLTNYLVDIMKANEIDSFDIKDGELSYKQTKSRAPITKKNLLTILTSYFKNNKKAEELSQFILDGREETIRETIHRSINK